MDKIEDKAGSKKKGWSLFKKEEGMPMPPPRAQASLHLHEIVNEKKEELVEPQAEHIDLPDLDKLSKELADAAIQAASGKKIPIHERTRLFLEYSDLKMKISSIDIPSSENARCKAQLASMDKAIKSIRKI